MAEIPCFTASVTRLPMRLLRILLVALVIALVAHPALTQSDTPQAAQDGADYESEPDLTGLLKATRDFEMTEIAPRLAIGSADYAPYGIRVHVFDFAQERFAIRAAEQISERGNRAPDFLNRNGDVFAINGGFFEREGNGRLSSSGLLIVDGDPRAPEHERAGSGVIYSGVKGVGIAYRKNFRDIRGVEHAIQVGPILVDPGGIKGIYKNAGGRFNRSAICLRGDTFTAFVVEGGISLFQFADILSHPAAEGGFGCDSAINLDGGPSTQAALRAGSTQRDIAGETTVHNALIVSERPPR